MKRYITILFIISAFHAQAQNAQSGSDKEVKVQVGWVFKNVEKGYDHDNKSELYIDGKLVATSGVTRETKKNKVVAKTTPGVHSIKVVNYALYEGKWEAHTIANNYSIDCIYETNLDCSKKNNKIGIIFDVDSGTIIKN